MANNNLVVDLKARKDVDGKTYAPCTKVPPAILIAVTELLVLFELKNYVVIIIYYY